MLCSCEQVIVFEDQDAIQLSRPDSPGRGTPLVATASSSLRKRALLRDMLKKNGRIDYDKLRKEGDSERLLAKLEQA
jgi:hypothetical protein